MGKPTVMFQPLLDAMLIQWVNWWPKTFLTSMHHPFSDLFLPSSTLLNVPLREIWFNFIMFPSGYLEKGQIEFRKPSSMKAFTDFLSKRFPSKNQKVTFTVYCLSWTVFCRLWNSLSIKTWFCIGLTLRQSKISIMAQIWSKTALTCEDTHVINPSTGVIIYLISC